MNKKYQNGNVIDHAFGLTKSTDANPLTSYSSSTSSKSVPIMFETTTTTTTTHSNFNFEDNFTESFNNDTSIITNKLESITIVGDAPITTKNESLSSLSSNNTTNSFNSQQQKQPQHQSNKQPVVISNNENNKKSIANSVKNEMSSGTASYSSQLTNSLTKDDSNTNPDELEEYDYEQEYDDAQLNIQTMRKVFNVFDSDQDGSITIEDVEIVMNSLQYLKNEIEMPSVDQIRIAFDKFDSNKNGSIEFDEFLNILKSANSQQTSSSNSIDDITTKTLPISTPPPPPPPQPQPLKPPQSSITNNTIQSNPIINNNININNKLNETSKATTNSYTNTNYNTFSNQKHQQQQSIVENSTDSNLKMNMKLIFEQFDKDNDGKITKNELNFVMSNLFPDEIITEQDIEIMLHAADLDKNGSIDFEEFANMFMLYSQNVNDVNASSEKIYQNSSSFSAKSNRITNNNNTTRNSLKKLHLQQKHLDLFERASLHSTKSNNLLKKNEITKSSKSLTRSIVSRSNSKDSAAVATANNQRSRTCSQTNTSTIINNQSPSNFRKVVQIFTTSQMMDLKAAFTMFDKNGDQKISESELLQVMKYLGLKTSESDVKAMIQVVDKNRNGYVDYDEFIQMMTQTQLKPLSAEEELRKTFNIFDIDGNGYISADEIKKTMAHLGENLTDEEVNDMIKAADKNGDGRIDLNEFSGLLNGQSGMSSGSSSGLKQSAK